MAMTLLIFTSSSFLQLFNCALKLRSYLQIIQILLAWVSMTLFQVMKIFKTIQMIPFKFQNIWNLFLPRNKGGPFYSDLCSDVGNFKTGHQKQEPEVEFFLTVPTSAEMKYTSRKTLKLHCGLQILLIQSYRIKINLSLCLSNTFLLFNESILRKAILFLLTWDAGRNFGYSKHWFFEEILLINFVASD